MTQSNRLGRLESILYEAVTNGEKSQRSTIVLAEAMNLDSNDQNIVFFYELLSKAKEDAISLRRYPRIDSYIKVIEELVIFSITNHLYSLVWNNFAIYLNDKNVLIALSALAHYVDTHEPRKFLDQDFLIKLKSEFDELSKKVLESDLSRELKTYLSVIIENILKAIRKYTVDGVQGLEEAAKSLAYDLLILEPKLKDEDKQNPILKQFIAIELGLVTFITPNLYDIIGVVAALHDESWRTDFQSLITHRDNIAKMLNEGATIQEVFNKAPDIFKQETKKSISGKEQKLITPAKEDVIN